VNCCPLEVEEGWKPLDCTLDCTSLVAHLGSGRGHGCGGTDMANRDPAWGHAGLLYVCRLRRLDQRCLQKVRHRQPSCILHAVGGCCNAAAADEAQWQ